MQLKGGVLIIGSLFWQDHKEQEGDNLRKKWREENLSIADSSNVIVPIRYGRFSKENVYTMVFDYKLPKNHFGIAKAVPFKETIMSLDQITQVTNGLSLIEGGKTDAFIKGNKKPWCICTLWINPSLSDSLRNDLTNYWHEKLQENSVGYKSFAERPSLFSCNERGLLDISWQEELNNLDFLIATSTLPKLRDGVKELTVPEIANHIDNRAYFYENRKVGITTFQDEEILEELKV